MQELRSQNTAERRKENGMKDGGRGVDRAYQGQAQSHKLPHTRDEG